MRRASEAEGSYDAAVVIFEAGEAEAVFELCKYGRVGEGVVSFIRIQNEAEDRDLALEMMASDPYRAEDEEARRADLGLGQQVQQQQVQQQYGQQQQQQASPQQASQQHASQQQQVQQQYGHQPQQQQQASSQQQQHASQQQQQHASRQNASQQHASQQHASQHSQQQQQQHGQQQQQQYSQQQQQQHGQQQQQRNLSHDYAPPPYAHTQWSPIDLQHINAMLAERLSHKKAHRYEVADRIRNDLKAEFDVGMKDGRPGAGETRWFSLTLQPGGRPI